MNLAQPGILEAVPLVARYVSFTLAAEALAPAALPESLKRLAEAANGDSVVVGIGPRLVAALGAAVPALKEMPSIDGDGAQAPSTPTWAHVKRTAQESFEPPAFMLRRSMPWTQSMQSGLMFVAFGCSHRAFEVQMRRMAGQDDGIVDAMFRISKPVSGSFLWCPPVARGRLDLRQLGL